MSLGGNVLVLAESDTSRIILARSWVESCGPNQAASCVAAGKARARHVCKEEAGSCQPGRAGGLHVLGFLPHRATDFSACFNLSLLGVI